MDRLPPEILCYVLEYSTWGHKGENAPAPNGPTIMTLKALRLCCRTFAELGARYLFARLSVYMTDSSFLKMRNIAEHPVYSHMVHELEIFPRLLSFLLDEDYYRKEVWDLLDVEADALHYPLSTEEVDATYGRFEGIWEDQMRLSGNVETRLRAAMDYFTQLHSMTSCTRQEHEMSQSRQLALPNEQSLDGGPRTHRGEYWDNYGNNTDDTISIIRAIASSRPLNSGILRGGVIFRSFSLDFVRLSAEDLGLIKRIVTRLTSFSVNVRNDETNIGIPVELGDCRRLLEWSGPKLERLSVVNLANDGFSLSFARVFGTIHWPRLSWLSLSNFRVHSHELITFLQRHTSTLAKLHLQQIVLLSASWLRVFTEIRGGALTAIEIQRLQVSDTEAQFCGCRCDACDETESWEVWQKDLNLFIIGDGLWPSKVLPSFLTRKVDLIEDESD